MASEHSQRALAQIPRISELVLETIDRSLRGGEQATDFGIALGVRVELTPLFDLAQPMPERADQELAAGGIVEKVVLKIRIPLDDPDVAQYFEQHSRRAAGAALGTKLSQQVPYFRSDQADDDLAGREH